MCCEIMFLEMRRRWRPARCANGLLPSVLFQLPDQTEAVHLQFSCHAVKWVLDWMQATGRLSESDKQRRPLILAQMHRMALQMGQRGEPPPDYQQLVDQGLAMEAAEVVYFVQGLIERAWEMLADPKASKAEKAGAIHDALLAGCMFGYLPPLRISVLLSILRDLVRCSPVFGCVLDDQGALQWHKTCKMLPGCRRRRALMPILHALPSTAVEVTCALH